MMNDFGSLRVVEVHDKKVGMWFCQGLEFDHAAQGRTKSEARDHFILTMDATLNGIAGHGVPVGSNNNPAPPEIWKLYFLDAVSLGVPETVPTSHVVKRDIGFSSYAFQVAQLERDGEPDHDKEVRQNYEAFTEMLPNILRGHKGEFALMRGREIIYFFDTDADAAKAGKLAYPDGLFSVQVVTDQAVVVV